MYRASRAGSALALCLVTLQLAAAETVDHVSPEDLKQAATIMASLLYHAAVRPEQLPRKLLPQAPPRS